MTEPSIFIFSSLSAPRRFIYLGLRIVFISLESVVGILLYSQFFSGVMLALYLNYVNDEIVRFIAFVFFCICF